ncbi:MAG: VanW family protein [Lachnospiraceae bacterium]|nr:VanW family protein [Lachnospiraceae bacterium]
MKKRIFVGLALLVFAVGSLGHVVFSRAESQDTIYQGIYIDGMDVGGMTKAEAEHTFEDYIEKLESAKVSFTAYGRSYDIAFSEMGLKLDGEDAVERAFAYGRTGNLLARYKEILEAKKSPVDIMIEKSVNQNTLIEKLENLTEDVNVKAKDASIARKNGAFVVTEEEVGKEIDYKATVNKMLEEMSAGWNGDDLTIALDIEETQPKYTAKDFEKVKDVIGTYSTKYTGTKDREKNLVNGCSKLDGTVLYPGEVLSVHDATSPYTKENGYYAANQYLNGEVISGVGGGICQVSTTLYNAVLRAELKVEERAPHSMVVTYVPKSADAAIAGTYKDFKFSNNTDTPIYIEAAAGGGYVSFTIYGEETRPESRTIEFESKILSTIQPGDEIETLDKSKPAGYRHVTQAAHTGYTAELWKYVYENGVLVDSIKINSSKYNPSPARVTVGPEKDTEEDDDEKTTEKKKTEETTEKKKTEEKTTEEKSTEEKKTEEPTEKEDEPEDAAWAGMFGVICGEAFG